VGGALSEVGDFVQVAETRLAYEAELIRLRLGEAGIEARVLDQTYYQEPVPDVRALSLVRVLVPAGREAEARAILAVPISLPEEAEQEDDPAVS
jgi:Putative prokaryotic signal transducing protein